MSHRSRTSRDIPAPSAPRIRQIPSAPRSPRSNRLRSAASSRPTSQIPASRNRSMVFGSPETTAIGTCSIAPADALATVGVTCTARCLGRITRSTPAPSQLLTIAPRLPGSVTPSTATRNGGLPGRRRRYWARSASGNGAAIASTPCGASLRAVASSFFRATYATGTRFAAAIATMSSTSSESCNSDEIQTSCTLRR